MGQGTTEKCRAQYDKIVEECPSQKPVSTRKIKQVGSLCFWPLQVFLLNTKHSMFDFQLKLSEYTLVYKKVDISEKMYIYIYLLFAHQKSDDRVI